MVGEINRVVMTGRLLGGVRLRRTKSAGTSVINFSIECDGKSFPCTMFGPSAVEMAGWAGDGKRVAVEGRLSKRSIPTTDGGSISEFSIKADKVLPMA